MDKDNNLGRRRHSVAATNNSSNMPSSSSSASSSSSLTPTNNNPIKPATISSLISSLGGGSSRQRKRKSSEADLAVRLELEELREWRRRVEEREKQLNSLFSASSSCSVCLDTRPDLISYGACGHMVCVPCTVDHVTRKLMILRRRVQNTGCKARLSYFALNVEDSEFSCPICRQGQLDLMGAGLALLPDFAYYQLIAYCAKTPNGCAKTPNGCANKSPPTTTTALSTSTSLESSVLAGLSAERRSIVMAELERNRQSSQKALQVQQHASSTTNPLIAATSAAGGGGGGGGVRIRCPFCDLCAAQPGETGSDKLLPTELLRHIWRCKKRSFICGFNDCRRNFTWESVYQKHAPASIGAGGDYKSEQKWLFLVNAAFNEHMERECIHMTQCCIGWCDAHRSPASIPLSRFHEHENRHKLIHDRFQGIATIADKASSLEKALASVLRAEFNLLPTPPSSAAGGGSAAAVVPLNGVVAVAAPTSAAAAAAAAAANGGVAPASNPQPMLELIHPIAREVHNSLEALGDLLRTYLAQTKSTSENRSSHGMVDLVGSLVLRCPLHGDSSLVAAAPRTRPRTRQERLEQALESYTEGPFPDASFFADDNADSSGSSGSSSGSGSEISTEEDPEEDDDDDEDEDYIPDQHHHNPSSSPDEE